MVVIGQKLHIPNEEILQYFDDYMEYEPETGTLLKFYPTPQDFRSVTRTNSEGYIRVYVGRKEFLGHHVAWYLYYGKWPSREIDHINKIRTDNIIDNLRKATDVQKTVNLSTQSKYGRCIWYKKRINKYEVCIRTNYERNYIGVFKTIQEAINARDHAELVGLQYELQL